MGVNYLRVIELHVARLYGSNRGTKQADTLGAFMNRNDACARAAAMLKVYAESGSVTEAGEHVGACATAVYYWLPYLGLDKKWLARVRAMEEKIRRSELGKALRHKHIKIATSVIKNLQRSPKKRSLIATAVVAKYAIPRTAANRIVGLAATAGTCQNAMLADRMLVDAMRAHLRMYPRRGFVMMYKAFLQDRRLG